MGTLWGSQGRPFYGVHGTFQILFLIKKTTNKQKTIRAIKRAFNIKGQLTFKIAYFFYVTVYQFYIIIIPFFLLTAKYVFLKIWEKKKKTG